VVVDAAPLAELLTPSALEVVARSAAPTAAKPFVPA
jgi:hypothetical protein